MWVGGQICSPAFVLVEQMTRNPLEWYPIAGNAISGGHVL